MAYITVNGSNCKSCGLCMNACPKKLIQFGKETNAMGYHPVEQKDPESCTGCKLCALFCPEGAIEVYK